MPNEPTVSLDVAMIETGIEPTLSMRDITKHYDAIAALTDVSFDVLPGEVHALLGENGAGKSTLMNVASGATTPDSGTIAFDGAPVEHLKPAIAQGLGIAIVHQHPALLPDMTVAENILVAVGREHLRRRDPDIRKAMRSLLDDVHFAGHLEDRVSSLSVARRHLLELAKAFAVSPRLLILDEPTAPLSQDSVELLFTAVRRLAAAGTAVVYITHRLAEVREIADRVTVLRDGKFRGTSAVSEISDANLLAMIIGRTLEATFPPKHTPAAGEAPLLQVEGLSGHGFDNISFSARKGEIVGIAGVVGNGQPALLRALAGRESANGSVNVDGKDLSRRALLQSSAYMPADRLTEGLMIDLNVRENAALTALDWLKSGPFVSRRREIDVVERELSELAVKAPSLEAPVSALSGGNQQKVVMARAMLSEPAILVADEPTQGVDVGARAEIYRILREVSAGGVPVVVASSDAMELEGLCDRVIVMSRGHAVATLEGDAVTEERIVHAAISATTHTAEQADASAERLVAVLALHRGRLRPGRRPRGRDARARRLRPGRTTAATSRTSTSPPSCSPARRSASSRWDRRSPCCSAGSISPSARSPASSSSSASFFVLDGKSPAVWVLGFVVMLVAAVAVGLLNGALIRFAKFTPVAATLVTYIGLGGLAFTLRDAPDGYIAASVTERISTKVGPVPVAFIVFVLAALGARARAAQVALRHAAARGRLGRGVGAAGRRAGQQDGAARLPGRLALTLFGAVVLLAQLGVGDPGQGTGYTLTSITAVVLGGTSLLGGRGTFIGTLMGAGLSVQVLNATVFLSLDQKWQYIFQGLLIVAAAIIYSQVRRSGTLARRQP